MSERAGKKCTKCWPLRVTRDILAERLPRNLLDERVAQDKRKWHGLLEFYRLVEPPRLCRFQDIILRWLLTALQIAMQYKTSKNNLRVVLIIKITIIMIIYNHNIYCKILILSFKKNHQNWNQFIHNVSFNNVSATLLFSVILLGNTRAADYSYSERFPQKCFFFF